MKQVFKYEIPSGDTFCIGLEPGAEILTVQIQHGIPNIWALVDPYQSTELRHFRLSGTGLPITEEGLKYIGTFQLREGSFVGHLFEIL